MTQDTQCKYLIKSTPRKDAARVKFPSFRVLFTVLFLFCTTFVLAMVSLNERFLPSRARKRVHISVVVISECKSGREAK